ncbi:elongation factor TS-domain-containing protein [Gorgonomyces haynaldii]|nr:elongation factor TS-domain-containing protein [Gorgonomyces haynaldii]
MAQDNHYENAIQWLKDDEEQSSQKRAQKLSSRNTTEGLVGVYSDGSASMVEINCETDFVAKSDLFVDLVKQVSKNAAGYGAGLQDVSVDEILAKKIEDQSVKELITFTIGKLGENIQLRRVVSSKEEKDTIYGAYSHQGGQSLPQGMGRISSLVQIKCEPKNQEIQPLARKLAQHISGFNPTSVQELYDQPYLFGGGSVKEILDQEAQKLGVKCDIVDFKRWECGEGLEKKQENFAEEVARQMK